jgi:uncharacterized OB-fold protein
MTTVQEPTDAPARAYEIEAGLVRLRAGKCPQCGALFCPTRLVCGGCGHRGLDELLLAPRGTVYTFTQVHQSTPEFAAPYFLAYVDFPEQVRVMLPALGDEAPRIGEAVEVVMAPGPRIVEGELEMSPHAQTVAASATTRRSSNG